MARNFKTIRTAINGLSAFNKILFRFFDMFEKKDYSHLHILSDGALYIEVFFGLIKIKSGRQKQITVFCSPSALAIIKKATSIVTKALIQFLNMFKKWIRVIIINIKVFGLKLQSFAAALKLTPKGLNMKDEFYHFFLYQNLNQH